MQGVSDVDAICNGCQCALDLLCGFDMHSRQTAGSFDRACDGRIVEFIYRSEHPEGLQQNGLSYPDLLSLEGCARARSLGCVIIHEQPYEHVRIDGDHEECQG